MIEIDRGVPAPTAIRPGLRNSRKRYPWADMSVGDSFLAKDVSRNAMRTTATYHEKEKGWRFEVAPDADGIRVWRIA